MEAESQQSTVQVRFYHRLKFWDATAYVLSMIGLLNAGHLWYLYAQPEKLGCTLSNCDGVRESGYSSLFGIDIPVWGTFFFLGIVIYSMLKLQMHRRSSRKELLGFMLITGAGFLFSLYLTYLELFVIYAICQWCVLSAIVSTLLFIVSIQVYRLSKPTDIPQLQPDESKQYE